MKRIVITGGTYAGKTTLMELFKKNGFDAVPDVGFEIIKELNEELGQKQQKEFRAKNPIRFYSDIIKRQIEMERSFRDGDKALICDRGVHDYLAMLKLAGIDIPESLTKLVRNISYDLVFVCETLPNFDSRKDSGRSLNKGDSLRLKDLIIKIYQNLGCKVVQVKEMPLNQRYDFIRTFL